MTIALAKAANAVKPMASECLHNFIVNHNVLTEPTNALEDFFAEHPTLRKIALIANHLFRAIAMLGLMIASPLPMLATSALCFIGSLFYRLTVEIHCAYKFALPAYAGSVAFCCLREAALTSLRAAWFLPLAAYVTYIVLTVDYDVDHS